MVDQPKPKKSSKKSKSVSNAVAPTLSSFLLSQTIETDSALDDIFATSKGPSISFLPKKEKKSKKVKQDPVASTSELVDAEEDAKGAEEVDLEAGEVLNDADLSEADSNESLDLPSDSDDDDGVEEAYAATRVAARLKSLAQGAKPAAQGEDSDEDDDDDEEEEEYESELDIENLMHETLMPKAKKVKTSTTTEGHVPTLAKPVKKAKVVSTDTPEERDARTIFMGNVPVACSTSRPMKKALIRHVLTSPALLALLPPSFPALKADTIRFRSLAFASTVFGRKATVEGAPEDAAPVEPGGRGRKRARDWRDHENMDERGVKGGYREKEEDRNAAASGSGGRSGAAGGERKGALTDGQKRRVAFIRGELNEGKKACNAYLVVDKLPVGSLLTMVELIKLIVEAADGSVFEAFTLRADHVRPRSSAATLAAAQTLAKPSTNLIAPQLGGVAYTVPPLEARRTLFMGGLDFAETEENIRAATELVLVREKGSSGERGWVERVRIIRDASTGLGKGFGYVLLRDAECVDEILALPSGAPLKVSKRKVRLERCKTGVAAARAKAAAATAREVKALPAAVRDTTKSLGVPRDPASFMANQMENRPRMSNARTESAQQARLAEALSKLAPAERKAVKSTDQDRLERRSAKKTNKRLGERYERKQAAADKSGGILGRPSRGEERARKEAKRVKAGNKTGKRAKPIK